MNKYFIPALTVFLLLGGCATYEAKYLDPEKANDIPTTKDISHTFYLIGDAGLSPMGDMNDALKIFREKLSKASKNSTAIFLGDNIYPAGLPDPKDSTIAYLTAKNHLDAQLKTLENFKGQPLFIPGNHDWYTEGLVGLKRQERYVEEALDDKDAFEPDNGCPIEEIEVSDDVVIIAIDTEWYLTNWDKRPGINDECEIKDRERFFLELEDDIKDNRERTTIIATHHPMFSYGPHGGQFSVKKQFYPKKMAVPLPVLGSFINLLRTTTGASIADLQNKRYRELRKRLITLAQYSEKAIVVSGHEHTLQYIVEENTPQIVSGSGAKKGISRLINGSEFSTGRMGYATLEVYTDGSSRVRYFGIDKSGQEEFLFTKEVLPADKIVNAANYDDNFPAQVEVSVYSQEEIDKTGFFRYLWGERYRNYYGTKIKANTVRLDTLYGGLTPVRVGGGHQSKSLRLRHKSGKEYVMRALRKSAELYLQAMAFPDQYIVGEFENTLTQDILSDFYTGAHPYAPFTTDVLSDAIGLYHTNPKLFYVPKQTALGEFNTNYGDELYMIEEHVSEGHGEETSFGFAKKIENTHDLIKNIREDEKYRVDEAMYVRARLFDMLIGDWDRHVDQWRWAEIEDEKTGDIIYRPIPRDRDQVYSIMGDGALMSLATKIVPGLRLMEGFNEEIRSVEGFNSSPKTYILDMAVLPETNLSLWEEQAAFIQENITPEVVEKALNKFPEEVRDETVDRIKRVLLARKGNLRETAREYYGVINRFALVLGTDKDDYFSVDVLPSGHVQITGQRIKDGEKADIFFKKKYDKKITKEIWVYGLDDDDIFEAAGKNPIRVRFVGGQNNDTYITSSDSKVYIYDYKSKKNDFSKVKGGKIHRTDNYNVNTYVFSKLKNSVNQLLPTIGFNPDDGIRIGLSNIYTYNGFLQNPFTQRHILDASFYFATSGFNLGYRGEFAHIFHKANLELEARFTSPNFSVNFFGFGNETVNMDDELELDFNRVKIQTLRLAPSLIWRGHLDSKVRLGISYEMIKVEQTENRFIDDFLETTGIEPDKNFFGIDGQYTFDNTDNPAFPTLGMATSLHVGYKTNTDETNQNFGYIIPSLSFDHRLIPNGRLVLATKWKAHFNIGDGYEFYQGASIGGFDGLRGFRNQRFIGKTSYYQNTDIRYSLRRRKTGILPISTGFFGGFDYGRVWFPNDSSNVWHTSYGGGFFVNGSDIFSANLALFNSDDGLRFVFGLGFGF